MSTLTIFAAGGHAKVVCDIARLRGWQVAAFVVPSPAASEFLGRPIVAEADALAGPPGDAAVALGDCKVRAKLCERLLAAGWRLPVLVHPSAVVAADVTLREGTVVAAGAILNPGAAIGRGGIINTAASVDHDCRLDEYVHVCPGARLAGGVAVGRETWIGIGATVVQNVRIGAGVTLGAGAVLLEDLPDGVVAYGVPARIARRSGGTEHVERVSGTERGGPEPDRR